MTRLVLVPGFTQTASSWDAVVAALHPSIEVRAVGVPVRRSFEETAAAIGEDGGPAAYCGYSMGGRLCLRLALDRPDLVTRLVLVSATPGIEDSGERAGRFVADEDHARFVEREGVEAFLARWLAQPMFDGVPADAPGVADRRALPVDYLTHCLRVLGTGTMQPMWPRLRDLSMPVTFVTGRRDEKFTAIGTRAAGIHGEQVVVDGGHAVPLEQPDALATILNERIR